MKPLDKYILQEMGDREMTVQALHKATGFTVEIVQHELRWMESHGVVTKRLSRGGALWKKAGVKVDSGKLAKINAQMAIENEVLRRTIDDLSAQLARKGIEP